MNNNYLNKNDKNAISEGINALGTISDSVKMTVKALKHFQNKNLRPNLKKYNMLKSNLKGMTELHNKNCNDLENFAKFLIFCGDISEDEFSRTLRIIENHRNAYLDFKRSQPSYIRKLMY